MTDLLPRTPDLDSDADILGDDDLPPVSDVDLEAQALAAAPADVADDDADCFWDHADRRDLGLLPEWYMPGPTAGARRLTGWKRTLAWVLIGTFLAIDAAGLCFTYGRIEGWGFGL